MATRDSGTREHFREVPAPQVGCGIKRVDSLSRNDNLLGAVGRQVRAPGIPYRHVDRDSGLRHVKVNPFPLDRFFSEQGSVRDSHARVSQG